MPSPRPTAGDGLILHLIFLIAVWGAPLLPQRCIRTLGTRRISHRDLGKPTPRERPPPRPVAGSHGTFAQPPKPPGQVAVRRSNSTPTRNYTANALLLAPSLGTCYDPRVHRPKPTTRASPQPIAPPIALQVERLPKQPEYSWESPHEHPHGCSGAGASYPGRAARLR